MKIGQIRNVIDTLNWNRSDATGGTRSENRRTDLPSILAPYIAAVQALQIPVRFADDLIRQAEALQYAYTVIARWHANNNAA